MFRKDGIGYYNIRNGLMIRESNVTQVSFSVAMGTMHFDKIHILEL